jgi:hypothetical protein
VDQDEGFAAAACPGGVVVESSPADIEEFAAHYRPDRVSWVDMREGYAMIVPAQTVL